MKRKIKIAFAGLSRTVVLGLALLLTPLGLSSFSHAQSPSAAKALALVANDRAVEGRALLEEAEKTGDVEAKFQLGKLLFSGIGGPVDLKRAAALFDSASQNGHINAPVWGGQTFEGLGNVPEATRLHRLALQRANHLTSLVFMARRHRAGDILGSNPVAAARFEAQAQVLLDNVDAGGTARARLENFSCYELVEALFVETATQSAPEPVSFAALTSSFTQCKTSENRSELAQALIAKVAERMAVSPQSMPLENKRLTDFLKNGNLEDIAALPPYANGVVTFASDSDSADFEVSNSAFNFLNDHLGLPIGSSAFVMDRSLIIPSNESAATPNRAAGFFAHPGKHRIGGRDAQSRDKLFYMARQWHRGRYDHLHSWYSYSRTQLLRPQQPSLANPIVVETASMPDPSLPLAADGSVEDGRTMRLYFTAQPPADLSITLSDGKGREIAVNTAELAPLMRVERDENREFFTIALTFPALYPVFAIEPGETFSLSQMPILTVSSDACGQECGVTLEKIETGPFDVAQATKQAAALRDANILPYGYTSHGGGDSWHVHGDPSGLTDYWTQMVNTTAERGKVHTMEAYALANIEDTKGYVEPLLTALNTRAVRPERLPQGRPVNHAIHDFANPYRLFPLYRDKMNLATTYFKGVPGADDSKEALRDYLKGRLADDADLVGEGCTTTGCGMSHTSMLPLLVAASAQTKAKDPKTPFSHIWYTHFGSPTLSFTPSVKQPFTPEGQIGFERLARMHFGFAEDGTKKTSGRVKVMSVPVAMRQRKLSVALASGLLEVEAAENTISVSPGIDPYLGRVFPTPAHEERDLAGLTVSVEDVFATSIIVNERALPLIRRRTSDTSSESEQNPSSVGWVSVVDTSNPHTLLFSKNDALATSTIALDATSGQTCLAIKGQAFTDGASHLEIGDPNGLFNAQRNVSLTLEITPTGNLPFLISPVFRKHHVFTTDATKAIMGDKAVTSIVHQLHLPPSDQTDGVTSHFVDLADPEKLWLPSTNAGSVASAPALTGTIRSLCIEVSGSIESGAQLGPIRLHRPSRSDHDIASNGLVIGGLISMSGKTKSAPVALKLLKVKEDGQPLDDGKPATLVTTGNGRYWGKVSSAGRYEIIPLSQNCAKTTGPLTVMIERNSLALDLVLDLSTDGCRLKMAGATGSTNDDKAESYLGAPVPTIKKAKDASQSVQIKADNPAVPAAPDIVTGRSVTEILDGRSVATVIALIDHVPLSAKQAVSVRYGASIYEPHISLIEIGATHALPYADTVVLGAEAIKDAPTTSHFLLSMAKSGDLQRPLAILFQHASSKAAAFHVNMDDERLRSILASRVLALSQTIPLLDQAALEALTVKPVTSDAKELIFPYATGPGDPVRSVHIIFDEVISNGDPVVIDYAGLVREGVPQDLITIRVEGVGGSVPPTLDLLAQDGMRTQVFGDMEGQYVFARPKSSVFSAVFTTPVTTDTFAPGRWLSSHQVLDETVVRLTPDFVNTGGQTNDLSAWQRSVKRSRIASRFDGAAAPHTRAWWGGAANKVSRFRGEFFRNNLGFHDIDVVKSRTDNCIVGAYLGESAIEAVQMKLSEKNTVLLSQELSVALQKCVIVHAIAPGNSIQSFNNLQRLNEDLAPAFVVFEMNASMFLYMTSAIQKAFFGYEPGFSPVGVFDLSDDGELTYRSPQADWISKAGDPSPTLPSGGALVSAFYLSKEHAAPEANRAWRLLQKLLESYGKQFPQTLHVVEGIYEQARCADQEGCDLRVVPAADGSGPVSGGTPVFEERLRQSCKVTNTVCITAAPDPGPKIFRRALLYPNDFHYTRHANVWHAKQLAQGLIEPLRKHLANQPKNKR